MIKKFILFLFIICFAQKGLGEEAKTYEEALVLSEKTNKKVILYFGADWCKYCKKMEGTFKDKQISEELDNFILLKLDRDKNKELSKEYGVKSIPDYMIMDRGQIIKRHTGYQDKNEFIYWLK